MYVGHVGIALGMRSLRGAPPLWLLVLAAQGPDWLDGVLDLAGYRWYNPAWSPHGLMPVLAGALVVGGIVAPVVRPRGARAVLLTIAAYLSHWAADFVTGWKPTWPGGPMVGLRLYGHPLADLVIEVVVIVAGWLAWRSTLAPSVRRARGALAALLLLTLLTLQAAADVVMARPSWLT